MNKQEILNKMTKSPEVEELNYPLTEHTGIYITSIVFRNEKWYINVWNDYQDYTVWEHELSESDALEYLTYEINRNDIIKECIELLGQDGIDSKQLVANKLKGLL